MKNKILAPIFVSTLVVLSALSFNNGNARNVKAQSDAINATRAVSRDFGTELTDPPSLNVSITNSTKTTLGQSFNFRFSTGGDGYNDRTYSYNIVPIDYDNFLTFLNDFNNKSDEEKNAIKQDYKDGNYQTEVYQSYVYEISDKSSAKNVIIPKTLNRDIFFSLEVVKIGENVVKSWDNIQSISIPNTVKTITDESFQNVPEGFIFNVEFAQNKIPTGWSANWAHGATVNYGTYTATKTQSSAGITAPNPTFGDNNANYMIGYHNPNSEKFPIIAEYKVKKNGVLQNEPRFFEFPLTSTATYYDFVGRGMGDGFVSVELVEDIPLAKDEEVDASSFILHNIFASDEDMTGIIASKRYVVTPKVTYTHLFNINEFIEYKFTRLSSFSGYTAIDIDLSIPDSTVYQILKPNYYNSHINKINSGEEYFRYRFTSLSLGSFSVLYEENGVEVSKTIRIQSPIDQVVLESKADSHLSFVLKNSEISDSGSFSTKNIKSVSINSLYVKIDIYSDRPIARSEAFQRFGLVEIMPYGEKSNLFDLNVFIIIFYVIYVLGFCGATAGLFFYISEKYKNDEFRRMKPKSFFKKAALALLGSVIVIGLVLFLIFRLTIFNNAIIVYNPVDAYIIVTGVLSVIIIGYFIRYLVVTGKAAKERRKIIKLKLNEDVDDDGTK